MFDLLKQRVQETKILSLDLETTSRNPAEAKLEFIALASGLGRGIEATAVKPSDGVIKFVVDCLYDPSLKIVGHNLICYDLEVLHHLKIIDLWKVKAKLIDTLPLSWLVNENIKHKLKFLAKKWLGVHMTEYEDAFLESPAIRKVKVLSALIAENEKKIEGLTKKRERLKNPNLKVQVNTELDPLIEKTEEMRADQQVLNVRADKEKRRYAADDARQTLKLYYFLRKQIIARGWTKWAGVELRARLVAAKMELNGIRIDREQLEKLQPVFEKHVEMFRNRVLNLAKEEINPRSSKDLIRVLYHVLGIPPLKLREEDFEGEEKTGEALLVRINHPLAQAILDFRVVDKLYGTYVQKIWRRIQDRKDWRLFCRMNTTGARTGRFSSSGPNLQNIPSRKKGETYDPIVQKLGKELRKLFVAAPGKKFVIVDLSQIELRLIAHVTQDENLMAIYNRYVLEGGIKFYTGDIHEATAKKLGIDRSLAKNVNFGLCYGLTAQGFCRRFKIFKPGTKEYDLDRGNAFREGFFELFEGIPRVIQFLGRQWEGSAGQYPRRQFKMLSGRLRRFKETDRHSPGAIFNAIIQGSAADVLKAGMIAVDEQILTHPDFAGKAKILLQIHDELIIEVDEDVVENVATCVKYAMERPWFELTVPVLASVKICDNWGQKDDDTVPHFGAHPKSEEIHAAATMLTEEQERFASTYVKNVICYSASGGAAKEVLSAQEYERING